MKWLLAALALLATCAAGIALALTFRDGAAEPIVLPQAAMPGRLLVGFQDDASLRWAADRATGLDAARDANATVIRTIAAWSDVASTKPVSPRDSFDAAYNFADLDDLARSAQQRGIELLITIWGTPPWANGGETPNRSPADLADLRSFAFALADRYSGRHPGYPAVRLWSAWNEPNLEQFLAPQFDEAGASVSPGLYAEIARAISAGVKEANPQALVAIGETSPRGQDRPSRGTVQDSHSPPRFARLLSEEGGVDFDAWAQHPYPPRPGIAPANPVRWPRVALGNIERFGESLDDWFGRSGTPVWITEYAHETVPDPVGTSLAAQARFVEDALTLAAGNPRVRMLVWFTLVDREGDRWQSGLIAADRRQKPAYDRFATLAASLDHRNPVVPQGADVVRVPVLELAYDTAAGETVEVVPAAGARVSVPLGADGWVEVPLDGAVAMRIIDAHGHEVERRVEVGSGTVDLD